SRRAEQVREEHPGHDDAADGGRPAGRASGFSLDVVSRPRVHAAVEHKRARGQRVAHPGYEPRHEMLDGAVVMGAVAAATSRLRLGTSVLIAPYRGPLNDARQLATIDVLSGGRLIAGVGAGWLAEEFNALGIPFAERAGRTDEAIEIYKRAWCDEIVS